MRLHRSRFRLVIRCLRRLGLPWKRIIKGRLTRDRMRCDRLVGNVFPWFAIGGRQGLVAGLYGRKSVGISAPNGLGNDIRFSGGKVDRYGLFAHLRSAWWLFRYHLGLFCIF
jgi:hypothetical protein